MNTIISKDIKAIAWDLDGTLIDSFGIYSDIVTRLAPSFGLQAPAVETLVANFHGALAESISNAFGGLEPTILERYEKQFLTEQEQYYLHIDEHILDDAAWLMSAAHDRGLKQVIVTNRAHHGRGKASPRAIVEHSRLKPLVNHIICGDEVGDYRKPDARVFSDLLIRWQVEPAQLLVIGDQHVDAQLALNVGSAAVIVTRGSAELAHADKLPDDPEDSVRMVRSLHEVTFAA